MARVARAEIARQLDEIAALLHENPTGLTREEVRRAYATRHAEALPLRTVLRRLNVLLVAGRVRMASAASGRAPVYLAIPSSASGSAEDYRSGTPDSKPVMERADSPGQRTHAEHSEPYVPLSREGAELRAAVQRPIMYRPRVGYDRTLLEGYRPGQDWYLPSALRERLHERGRTPDDNRPAGTFARDIYARLLIDLAWASSHLEGNTYDRLDTQNLLEFGQSAEGKDAEETQMILNHKRAIEILVEGADQVGFNTSTLLALHAALAENLLRSADQEGRLRTWPVEISGTTYTPMAIPQVIEGMFDLLLEKSTAIPDPFEQAFFAMVHIPYLQPFADVNKRTSRIAANIPLIADNLCPLSFVDLPRRAYIDGTLAVYEARRVELLRDVFEWAYLRSCEQYKVVRDSTVPPDPVRLRYRAELNEATVDMVRAGAAPSRKALRQWAATHDVSAVDLEAFVERALERLLTLNVGTASRAGLRPSEYQEWRARFSGLSGGGRAATI